MDEIDFVITEEALDFIVDQAIEYKLGAEDYVPYVKLCLRMLCSTFQAPKINRCM